MSDDNKEALPGGVAKGMLRDNLEVICFAILLIVFFKTFVGQQFVIPSASMRNSLMIGDHLLANKFVYATPQWSWEEKLFPMRGVQRGDIIVFRYPCDRDKDYVKRCVALPGDTVEVRDKRLYLNGELCTGAWEHHVVKEEDGPLAGPWPLTRATADPRNPAPAYPAATWPFADPEALAMDMQGHQDMDGRPFLENFPRVTVPPGRIFAMGDNRDRSADSRFWGFLPVDHLRGSPFIVWWSYREGGNDDTDATPAEGALDVLLKFTEGVRYFFTRTRWERTGVIPR
jgi:signal peptidase I